MIDLWDREELYQQLARVLRKKIDSGEWSPGRKIPSEPTLAQTYALARGTVRKALELLREEGKIVTFPGRGSFVPPKA